MYVKGLVVLHRCRKYVNDARPLNFKDNRQNMLTVVTEHKCTFILLTSRYNNRRAKWAKKKIEIPIQKYPLIMPKILKCCSLRCIFWKSQGVQTPPPLDPRLSIIEHNVNYKYSEKITRFHWYQFHFIPVRNKQIARHWTLETSKRYTCWLELHPLCVPNGFKANKGVICQLSSIFFNFCWSDGTPNNSQGPLHVI